MRVACLLLSLVVVVGCSDEDKFRHIPDAPAADDAGVDALGDEELTVTLAGNGGGEVTSHPDGIDCTSATCKGRFAHDTEVELTATSDAMSVFDSWGGACSGNQPTCKIDLAHAQNVTATFKLKRYTVTIVKGGGGGGTVSGSGIACGSTCSIVVDHGTAISLSQTPASLSVFAGWGGGCSGTGACNVTITHDTQINANFALDNFTLFVARGGTGSGSVASSPAGISCGTDCDQTYSANQAVTLTASPATGSTFTGWNGGGCSGTGTCGVTITAATTVTANFTLKTFPLSVTKNGNGTGLVTGGPINCGSTCSATLDYNTPVTLTATPSTGATFAGWGGACSGTGTCSVTMTAMKSVTATFTLQQFTVTVNTTGYGTVTGPNLSCSANCTQTYNYGTPITLSAAPGTTDATLSTFTGWSGACSGTSDCSLTITSDVTVGAAFTLQPNIMFVTNSVYTGDLAADGGYDQICTKAATTAGLKGNYRAYISYGYATLNSFVTVDAPSRFAGVSGWVRTDGTRVMNDIAQMHKGTLYNPPLLTEYGTSVANTQYLYVWTGTYGGVYNDQCSSANGGSWNGTSNAAWAGKATVTTPQVVSTDTFTCVGPKRLYCLGIDRAATVP